jgi:hypothetical protein
MSNPPPTSGRHLRVRYYPRRMDRAAAAGPRTPSQALHLPTSPDRAAQAQSTALAHDLDLTVPGQPAAQPHTGLRAWWRRLFRR